ncbi:translocation/assembly module TamB domain-containing protein [Brevundimonas sp.]|uniref:translocation/assembly module TamB domain-containing protein n=2 Tax=unclassified Brevundimonas TaxID=2622653 RepID=UPI0028A65D5E|nr:translocation/assembly module TamB domain-containing protein [Brevundimonas sp.]
MTDTPPPHEPEAETPAKAEKRKRTRLQLIAFVSGVVVAALLALSIVLAIGGRMYLVSDSGRELITSFVAGKKISRYGRINVEGLKGDLFDDFTLERVTITDADGVWLEATNVRLDWSYWPLLMRRFHATEIRADQIRLLRRPQFEPRTEPGGPQALSVDIDKFSAKVELMEGFSKEYGRWTLSGDAEVPRRGDKKINVDAFSLNRQGDHLLLKAIIGKKPEDLRVNLRAGEAQGGPIAGALGYSPDKPFSAIAVVNGELVDVEVKTGDFTPLTVKGRYGKTGARIGGAADFSGSDLLEPFARRIGQRARFGFASLPVRDAEDVQAMSWTLTAENITTRASGLINLKQRAAPDGVKLTVATPSLTRLAGPTLAGATTYTGVFKGDANRWSLQGSASLQDTDLASYRAARVSGPLDLSYNKGQFDVVTDARAVGGSTAGIIGALLGATPHVKLEGSRTSDGAYLLKKIDGRGQALTLTGSGGRNLTGGLSFRGDADITDISRIRPGAKGSFKGPIQAGKARNGPWTISFDGRASRLSVGMDELDRLLGQTPRLAMAGTYDRGVLAINRGELTGAAGRMGAKGLIEGGKLRLALDWDAHGPFGVGPVAIDGAMSGNGALTGTLAQPRADLRAAFDKVAAGGLILTNADLILSFRKGADASDGRIVLNSGSNYGPARASGNFFLGGKSLRLTEVDVNAGGVTAQGAIALSNNYPSSADLTFTARQGAFLASGEANGRVRLTDGGGDQSAVLDVTGRNVRLAGSTWVVRNLSLKGQGTLERLPFSLAADVGGPNPVQFNGTGEYSRQGPAQSVTLRGGGRVREVAFTTRAPAVIALNGDGRVVRVDLGVGGGVLTGELRQDRAGSAIQAELTNVEMGSLVPDLRGQVTGRVSLQGAGDRLNGSANVDLKQLRSIDAPRGLAVDGALNADLNDNVLRIRAQANDGTAVQASADVSLPVVASAAPLRLAVERTREMSGQIAVNGQIQPIWDLFLGGAQSLSGQIASRATLGGTLNDPRLNGRLDLTQGAFRDSITGLRLEGVSLASRFDDNQAVIERFEAADGVKGTVTGNGNLGLRQGSGSTLRLELTRFRVIDNDIAEARANGVLTAVRGADGNIQLSGDLNIDQAEISPNLPGSNGVVKMDVVEINRPGGDPVEAETKARGPQIGLNLNLTGREIHVRGRGLNVELTANARVRGTITRPQLTGTANVVRGDYEFAGKRFVFDDSGSVTLSTDPARIRLNLAAVREDPALTATIKVTGTAAQPKIELTSSPSLPQDEILSQVLFGRSASQLSGFEAAQLASAVASLAGGGGFDVIGNLRELAGLDRLSFGGEASSLTVAGGRYITDDVYLEIIGGGEGGAAVNVEWQVRRNLAVSSKFGGEGDASISVRWRRESDRPGGGATDRRRNRSR